MKVLKYLLLPIALIGCNEPAPRKPVKVKSGSFFTESVERNKRILEKEEAQIQKIIVKDSTHSYSASASGFWYYKLVENDSVAPIPETDDTVLLSYSLTSFDNDTIYSQDDIGIVNYRVDKQQLFPGLRNGIRLLREGERALFLFPSSQAYGYHGDENKIGPITPLKATVEIIKVNKKADSLSQKPEIQ
ncbi:MAG: gliding motility-associated peptidyl-prolyl isomerase GldI [Bacteroidota bacterium]